MTIPREEARRARIQLGTPVEIIVDEETGGLHTQALVPRTRPDFVKLGTQVIQEKKALLDRLADDSAKPEIERINGETRRQLLRERRPIQTESLPIFRD